MNEKRKFKLEEDIYLIDKALWLEKQRLLCIADLHIGYEEYLNEQGIAFPRQQFKIIKEEVSSLLNLKPKTVLINGDLKHEFGRISKQEWRETNEILDLILSKAKLVLVKGNHDTIIEPIARKKDIKIVEHYFTNKFCFMHGHQFELKLPILDENIKWLILAHLHPIINLREGIKNEKYKCWLVGKWKGKKIIIMPSFLPYVSGAHADEYSLDINFNNFDVFAIGDKIYPLGKFKQLIKNF